MRRDEVIQDLIMNIHHKYIKNEYKGDWRNIPIKALLNMFKQELLEFDKSLEDKDYNNAIKEVADIALFGAYIVDKLKNNSTKY
jgi:hypothetical protein